MSTNANMANNKSLLKLVFVLAVNVYALLALLLVKVAFLSSVLCINIFAKKVKNANMANDPC